MKPAIRLACPSRGSFLMLAVLIGMMFQSVVASSVPGGSKLLEADDSRVVFEIDLSRYTIKSSSGLEGTEALVIPGFGSFSQPGEARVPGRTFLVALPPAGGYSVRHTVQRSQSLGKRRLEPVPFPLVLNDDDGEPFASQEYRIDPQIYDRAPSIISVAADPVAHIRHQRVLPIRV
ncbi:MAG: hypothetical protein JSW58_07755, partial [Candidatus Latescibacterota bacterium]